MKKKILSLLLAALMLVGLLPAAAFAAEGDAAPAAPAAEEEVIPAPAEEEAPVTQAAEEDAAPAVQADEGTGSETNTAPTLRDGVKENVYANGEEGKAFTLDLSTIFADEDGDTLTYYVSVNNEEYVKAEKDFSYICTGEKQYAKLIFKANDGTVDSDKTYTVNITVLRCPVINGESTSTVETTTGTPVKLSIKSIISQPDQMAVDYLVSTDGGVSYTPVLCNKDGYFIYAAAESGEHTLLFKAVLKKGMESPIYTWIVKATGETKTVPTIGVKAAAEPATLWTADRDSSKTKWMPAVSDVFEYGNYDDLVYAYSTDGGTFDFWYPDIGFAATYSNVGEHDVTLRAQNAYGVYADFTVHIIVKLNHAPTMKAGVPDNGIDVFVPVGLRYILDANDYFEDADEKDAGNVLFRNANYGGAGFYTASKAGDIKTETAYGSDGVMNSSTGLTIRYYAIGPTTEETIKMGGTYTLKVADLGLTGSLKVRVNAGAEEEITADTYTFTPTKSGEHILHFYTDSATTVKDNVVVKLTTEWPKITKFSVDTVSTIAVEGEEKAPTLHVKKVEIEQYEKLEEIDGNMYAGFITITLKEDFLADGRAWVRVVKNTATITDSNGNESVYARGILCNSPNDWVNKTAVYLTDGDFTVYYQVKIVPAVDRKPIVTIGDKSYDVEFTGVLSDQDNETYWGSPENPEVYKVVVPENFETLKVSLKYTAKTAGDDEGTVYVQGVTSFDVPNHTNCDGEAGYGDVSSVIDTTKYNVLYIWMFDSNSQATILLIQVGEPKANTAPTLADGVEATASTECIQGTAYTLDLSKIFTDAESSELTYYVSENGADFKETAKDYSYTCTGDETNYYAKLIFKASDGELESETYTVSVKVHCYPKFRGLSESSVSAKNGEVVRLKVSNLFIHPNNGGMTGGYPVTYYVKVDDGEYTVPALDSQNQFSWAASVAGEHKLLFKLSDGTLESPEYVWTVTTTGDEITNTPPVVKETAPTGPVTIYTENGNHSKWNPPMSDIFYDANDFNGTNDSENRLTFEYRINNGKFRFWLEANGFAGDKSYLGENSITVRTTDPYGASAEHTVTVIVEEDHMPTRKENTSSTPSVYVPVGLRYNTLDANDYYVDVDTKDQGNIVFITEKFSDFNGYLATTAGKQETIKLYGSADGVRCLWSDYISVTFYSLGYNDEKTLHPGDEYTLNLNELGIAGNYKVRVNAGEEEAINTDTYTFTAEEAGEYILHFYTDKTASADENYVVKLTVEKLITTWPKITGFSVETVIGSAVDGEDADQTLTVNRVLIEQYEELQDSTDGTKKIGGCITVAVNEDFVAKGRQSIVIARKTTDITVSDGIVGSLWKRTFNAADNYTLETPYYADTEEMNFKVYYTVKIVPYTGPITVTIGDTAYDVELTALTAPKADWGTAEDVKFYKTVVPENFESLTVKVFEKTMSMCCWCVDKANSNDTTSLAVPNHTCTTDGLGVDISTVVDTNKNIIPVIIQYSSEKLDMLLIQVGGTESETKFAPVIGNGTGSESKTENGVTTFPAGSGTGAPTITVTAPASGWVAGDNTFTVACGKACVVLVKSGETYTKLTAANSGDTHSFTATLAEGDEIIVRLKGDVNGDGVVNNTDTIQARAASLGKATLTEINAACAKVVGGTAVTNTDVIQIGAVALGKAAFQW